ncbi:hypothetical protein BU16DRAFT_543529 [Lophium mytilinum]|uniref:F-box domain-containing protein n=1 Tax=Lophium mytilinum TaxID=390894 RepID=A0A6A6QDG3_9PEZI|nr:hypothetical protein BU16DRAFT_543529 [Lophium mytilinum]
MNDLQEKFRKLSLASNPATLSDLPTELAHIICEHLDTMALQSLRLVNKMFCDVVDEHLIPKVTYRFQEKSWKHLDSMLKHPVFKNQITALCIDTRSVIYNITDDDRRQYLEMLPARFKLLSLTGIEYLIENDPSFLSEISHPSFNICDLLGRLKDQQQQAKWQTKLYAVRESLGVVKGVKSKPRNHLTKLLASMPKLTDVHIRSKYPGGSLIHKAVDRRTCLVNGSANGDIRNFNMMHTLFLACSHSKKTITRLTVDKVTHHFLFNRAATSESKTRGRRIDQVTESLNSISLEVTANEKGWNPENYTTIRHCRQVFVGGHFYDFIRNMTMLRTMHVRMSPTFLLVPRTRRTVFPGVFSSMFGQAIWPKLEEFSIGNIEASEESLIFFISAHKATLKKFHLETIMLSTGCWASLLPRLRDVIASTDTKLETITLRGHLLEQVNDPRIAFEEIICDGVDGFQARRAQAQQTQVEAYINNGGRCPVTMDNPRCEPRRHQPLFPVIF